MREPRSVISKQISPASYFGAEQDEPAPRGPIARFVRAFAEGLLPLVILVALLGLFWEASVIGRLFATPYGIDALQRTEMVTAGGGLVVALIVYLISMTRTLQGVREHQRSGAHMEAFVTLTVLIVCAVVTLAPLLIALATPQHPAP